MSLRVLNAVVCLSLTLTICSLSLFILQRDTKHYAWTSGEYGGFIAVGNANEGFVSCSSYGAKYASMADVMYNIPTLALRPGRYRAGMFFVVSNNFTIVKTCESCSPICVYGKSREVTMKNRAHFFAMDGNDPRCEQSGGALINGGCVWTTSPYSCQTGWMTSHDMGICYKQFDMVLKRETDLLCYRNGAVVTTLKETLRFTQDISSVGLWYQSSTFEQFVDRFGIERVNTVRSRKTVVCVRPFEYDRLVGDSRGCDPGWVTYNGSCHLYLRRAVPNHDAAMICGLVFAKVATQELTELVYIRYQIKTWHENEVGSSTDSCNLVCETKDILCSKKPLII
ncbi:C-type lectin protein [Ranid herpesvirus 3]|uniref:C-type lectin protein n=1 Tax=Ranid herpesvirus 3 TaxID=1987509 RepID=A0A1X9T5G3_9VIRU|nr:C-type lectin protein [Ranid herpesvirus 3]ARR28944.1 C-type lectin protein [Ranid herpesvirus 3]